MTRRSHAAMASFPGQAPDLSTMVNGRHSNFLPNMGANEQGRFDGASVKVLKDVVTLLARPAGRDSP